MTTDDVVNAIKEQNVQVAAAGIIGGAPIADDQAYQFTIRTKGRLETTKEFEEIVIRATTDTIVRLRDVARVELGSKDYFSFGRLDNSPSSVLAIYTQPDANAWKPGPDQRANGPSRTRFPRRCRVWYFLRYDRLCSDQS